MSKGWIKIHRQITDSEIWDSEEPFDRRSAWIDLIIMVNHQDKRIIFNGLPMIVRRGQVITSIRKLADRWNWSRDRVSRYLSLLESLGMITKKSDKNKTLLTLVKYSFFQDVHDSDKDSDEYSNKAQTKNVKNEKNIYSARKSSNKFCQFPSQSYDFEEIEKILGDNQ